MSDKQSRSVWSTIPYLTVYKNYLQVYSVISFMCRSVFSHMI